MYAVTALGVANFFVNHYITLWGYPVKLFLDNGPQFCSELSRSVYHLIGARRLTTSSYHAMGNGGTEHVNHTMAQVLACIVNERQDDWDERLPHVEFSYNNSVITA